MKQNFPDRPTVSQIMKKYPTFMKTAIFVILFSGTTDGAHSGPYKIISLNFFMLFFPLRLGIPSGLFQSDFYRHFSFTPCLLTIPHMLLYLITVTIFKADYKF